MSNFSNVYEEQISLMLIAQSSSLCVGCAMGMSVEGVVRRGWVRYLISLELRSRTYLKEKQQAEQEQSLHGSKASRHRAGRHAPRPEKEWWAHAKVGGMAWGYPRQK